MTSPHLQIGSDYIGVGVGAIIINNDGKIFLSKRGQQARNEVEKWEIPGGAIEFGETLEAGLKREVKEEFGVDVKVLRLFKLSDHILEEEHQHWVSPTYICRIVSGTPRIMEPHKCDQIGWYTLDQAESLPLSIITANDIAQLRQDGLLV